MKTRKTAAPGPIKLRTVWWKSFCYYIRAHIAVFLGCAVACATLTGALLVGSLLRQSLVQLNQWRLGTVQDVIIAEHFFDADLAQRLSQHEFLQRMNPQVVPVIQLAGTVLVRDSEGKLSRYVNRVQVLGVPDQFWQLFGADASDLTASLAVNDVLAKRLKTDVGSLVEVRLPRPQTIPSETIAGRATDESGTAWQSYISLGARRLSLIVPADRGGRFSIYPQAQPPLNVYLPLSDLQRRLRDAINQESAANVLLIGAVGENAYVPSSPLAEALRQSVRLKDYGLRLRSAAGSRRYISLESNRLLLEDHIVEAATRVAGQLQWSFRPTLTYLVNLSWCPREWYPLISLAVGRACANQQILSQAFAWRTCFHYVPYMTVTVLDPTEEEPWGPFFRVDGSPWKRPLRVGEILLTEPAARDLLPILDLDQASQGPDDIKVHVRYFVESSGWLLKEQEASLLVAGVVAWKGGAVDPTLTPDFPGLQGPSPADWKPPFPRSQWHPEWIRAGDDQHWRKYRAAPRAFVSSETAKQLGWLSQYGKWTSVRLSWPNQKMPMEEAARIFERQLLRELVPDRLGFRIAQVQIEAKYAIQEGPASEFGFLFLGFSSFLMVSALLLIVLLVRLHVQGRSPQFGLLAGLGFGRWLIRFVILRELALVVCLGCLTGLLLSVIYARGLVEWIRWNWPADTLPELLQLDRRALWCGWVKVFWESLLPGFAFSLMAALAATVWALRELDRWPLRTLLSGQVAEETVRNLPKWGQATAILGAIALAGGGLACLVAGLFRPTSESPIWFFASGGLLLVASLTGLSQIMRRLGPTLTRHPHWFWLGLRFVARQPGRNLLTAALLAVAVFLISAVQVFYKLPPTDPYLVQSGTGGFPLLAETDIPLPFVPQNEAEWQAILPEWTAEEARQLHRDLKAWGVRIYPLRVRTGEDVSCLNLYRPQRPRILAAPGALMKRDGFVLKSYGGTLQVQHNPWLSLHRTEEAVPVFADKQTTDWVLHIGLGEEFEYFNGPAGTVRFRLVGQFYDSIFQGALVIAEKEFVRLFPGQFGYAFFLIEATSNSPLESIRQRLESALGEHYGMSVRSTIEVLAEFQAIENLYLLTFQLLGGIGLMLGASGLGVVLLRNVWERRGECALLQAVGYSRKVLGTLLLIENGTMAILGLVTGLLAAMVSVVPHFSAGGNIEAALMRLGIMVVAVLVVGLAAGSFAVRRAVRLPVLSVLRRE